MLVYKNQLNKQELDLLRALAADCYTVDKGLPVIYYSLLEKVRAPEFTILCFVKNTLIGFLSAYFFSENTCEITLLVSPSYRRQGYGQQLLFALIPSLQDLGLHQLIFSMPAAINKNWLTSLGFRYEHSEYQMLRQDLKPMVSETKKLTFQEAEEKDIAALIAIDSACFPSTMAMQAHFKRMLEDPTYTLIMASYKEKIIAKAHIHWQAKETVLSDIAVLPSYQKQGLGSELLTHCINQVLEKEHIKLTLQVEESNSNAVNLYLRHGFSITNTIDFWTIPMEWLLALI